MPTLEEVWAAQAAAGVKPVGAKDRISEFYSALSGHLDALFDDSRWTSSGPYRSLEKRETEIGNLLVSLREMGVPADVLKHLEVDAFRTAAMADRGLLYGRAPAGRLYKEIRDVQAELDWKADAWEDLVDGVETPAEGTEPER
jgi:hypothetical protein